MSRRARWLGAGALLLGGCSGDGDLAGRVEALERRQGELVARLGALESRPSGAAGGPAAPSSQPAAARGTPVPWPEVVSALAGPEAEAVAKVRALLQRGADLDGAGPNGERALVLAAQKGQVGLLKVLLEEARLPIDQREENQGLTALMAAAASQNTQVAEVLLAAGADATLLSGLWPEDRGGPFLTARGLAEPSGARDLAIKLEAAAGARSDLQGLVMLVDRVQVMPPPGAPPEPLLLVLGRQEGAWGQLELEVGREPLILSEEEGTSIVAAVSNENLYRVPLTWRRGAQGGRHDLVVNHPNASELVIGGVVELDLPEGRVRVDLVMRPLDVE